MKHPDDVEKVRMQESSVVAGIDWAAELHAVGVLGGDGKVIERFDVTHESQALHVMVSKFRKAGVTKVAIERGDGPAAGGIDRCGDRGFRCSVASDQSFTDPLRLGREQG
ncbi:hypothetical protein [Rhodococcus sp. IEGM 1379]|uniref:hypothetical protein n=1 Tax=Rhodococcus sp. IEGM 1379 TaxID=3047086 RepID=UPI0024B77F0A|nr:hypothetical protein [Rhodococcus sp. IEGM 1379]MDI9918713.1 hypothetical protein [Rhodococcus sp. IEGM 1379]